MDSIRGNRTLEDVVTEIEQELSVDISGHAVIVLVEGSDDIYFMKNIMPEEVICIESHTGKHGLDELAELPVFQKKEVIAVRDRDYANPDTFPEGMFAYDKCCLELMLLSNRDVANSFYNIYYKGHHTKEDFVIKAMRELAPYSLLRRKNEWEGLRINFERSKFRGLIEDNGNIKINSIFENLEQSEKVLNECCLQARALENEELWDITNGHDMCYYLGRFSQWNSKGPMGEQLTRLTLMGMYRQKDFEDTELYHLIYTYQEEKQVHFVN